MRAKIIDHGPRLEIEISMDMGAAGMFGIIPISETMLLIEFEKLVDKLRATAKDARSLQDGKARKARGRFFD